MSTLEIEKIFVRDLIAHGDSIRLGKNIPGDELALLLKQISKREIHEGGPYGFGKRTKVADLSLNLSIAYFLSGCGVELSNLNHFINNSLDSGDATSLILDNKNLQGLIKKYRTPGEIREEKPRDFYTKGESHMMRLIRSKAQKRFRFLSKELKGNAVEVIEKTIRGNKDKQMSLMSYFFKLALGKQGKKIKDEMVAELGIANVFFWSAFIVYDDFWDEDEAAQPKQIPVANVFARHYTDFFTNLGGKETKAFRKFFHERMDKLDAANTWELAFCRLKKEGGQIYLPERLPEYKDFGIKYYPAAGHIFGPVSMLLTLGYKVNSPEIRNLENYFRHYLIAMQLNDDAHDWREDLERGNISTAVYLILKEWQSSYPNRDMIDLDKDMPELERIFWFKVIAPLSKSVLSHTELSRKALKKLKSIEDPAPLEQFILRNERTALEALGEQENSEKFLSTFRGS